jgi:lipoyl-dependent peroxiredoxin
MALLVAATVGLDIRLSLPGSTGIGTNPEQLFAAGWSACFETAIGIVAHERKVRLSEIAIDAEIDLHLAGGEYFISARLNITLPGLDHDIAASLIKEAEQICTYSKVVRGNVEAAFNLI